MPEEQKDRILTAQEIFEIYPEGFSYTTLWRLDKAGDLKPPLHYRLPARQQSGLRSSYFLSATDALESLCLIKLSIFSITGPPPRL